MSTVLPLVTSLLWSSRHFPPTPVMALPTTCLIVQVKAAEPDAPVLSRARTTTLKLPAVCGCPEIVPVDEPMDSPLGRPVALQVSGLPPLEVPVTWRLTWTFR